MAINLELMKKLFKKREKSIKLMKDHILERIKKKMKDYF